MDSRSLYIVVLHAYVQFVLLVSKENVVKSAEALRTSIHLPLRMMVNRLIEYIESLLATIAKKDEYINFLISIIRHNNDMQNLLIADIKTWRTRLSQRDRKITMLLRNEKSLIQQRDELQEQINSLKHCDM